MLEIKFKKENKKDVIHFINDAFTMFAWVLRNNESIEVYGVDDVMIYKTYYLPISKSKETFFSGENGKKLKQLIHSDMKIDDIILHSQL